MTDLNVLLDWANDFEDNCVGECCICFDEYQLISKFNCKCCKNVCFQCSLKINKCPTCRQTQLRPAKPLKSTNNYRRITNFRLHNHMDAMNYIRTGDTFENLVMSNNISNFTSQPRTVPQRTFVVRRPISQFAFTGVTNDRMDNLSERIHN